MTENGENGKGRCGETVTNVCPIDESTESSSLHLPCNDCLQSMMCVCKDTKRLKPKDPPNLQHELNTATGILKECSIFTGDNVFDHLSDLIRKIIDNRPSNIIDYFEEFSRTMREQKFRCGCTCLEVPYCQPRYLCVAKRIIEAFKLPEECPEIEEEACVEREECIVTDYHQLLRPVRSNENIFQLQMYWNLCGFGFQYDEIFQLSLAMMKLIQIPCIENCRFWGKIYGIEKHYYIVEVELTEEEKFNRLELMKQELKEKAIKQKMEKANRKPPPIPYEMIPGCRPEWSQFPEEVIAAMQPKAEPIPIPCCPDVFDIPPEPIGSGLNRKFYFVVNDLTDDWIELPIVTPKQVCVAREMKKFFTGNLDASVTSYPVFPGVEKHYLRATIARITSGTYIAPHRYYKVKKKKSDGEEEEEVEEEEEQEEEDEIGGYEATMKMLKKRNAEITTRDDYASLGAQDLAAISQWVHFRPSILKQGRIMYYDPKKKPKDFGDEGEEEEQEEEEEEEHEEEEEEKMVPEDAIGPPLFAQCEDDCFEELMSIWTPRFSSYFNKMNQIVFFRSNLWPGAFSFACDCVVDSIYFGWGQKYVPRNYSPPHVPFVQCEYPVGLDLQETIDPSVKMEREWELAHRKCDKMVDDEELEDLDVEEI